MNSKKILVILDRDGVINIEGDSYVTKPSSWNPIPGSLEAISKLSKKGIKVAIATNQSGIGSGIFSDSDLEKVHNKMLSEIKKLGGNIDSIKYCSHKRDDGCLCRKPESKNVRRLKKGNHS